MLNVAVMGSGWAAEMHVRAYKKLSNVNVTALFGHNETHTKAIAGKYSIPSCYTDYNQLLDKEKPDIVSVCTPNYNHFNMSIDSMASGANVLCEKPAAISSDQINKMIETRNKTNKKLAIAHQKRFTSEAKYLKSMITRGVLGEIYNINAQWVRCQGIPGMGGWFTDRAKSGGGALIDIGVHVLDLALWFLEFPEIKSVQGICGSRFGNNGLGAGDFGKKVIDATYVYNVEDYATAQIITKSGVAIQLQCAWAAHVKEERFNVELWGDKCGASLCPPEVYSSSKKYSAIDMPSIALVNEYDLQIADFVNSLSDSSKSLCTAEQALTIMNIVESIYK